MIIKEIILGILLVAVIVFPLRMIYGLFAFMFRKDKSAMYMPSFNRHISLMKQHLRLVRGKKLVDLGCGDGKAMRFFSREFGLQCDGYEIQHFPHLYGKILNKIFGYPNLRLLKKNFLLADIHGYDYIYVYLLPTQMANIESRIFKNISDHAIIISNSFQFSFHKPYDVIKDSRGRASIFMYKK
ncbi:MAG: hypothetical protein NTY80_04745 [candidate division SR1 bacterium]|nr:hypothetical protein [candidate division SR1 bacterium]